MTSVYGDVWSWYISLLHIIWLIKKPVGEEERERKGAKFEV